jgi:dipicolinate synthase subunit B
MIGYAMCGSFCTHAQSLAQLEALVQSGYEIQPIMSETVYTTDTRFGKARDLIDRVEELCGRSVIHTIVEAEPLGPRHPLDALIISPCTGNTLAKLSCGITDTAVCMAAKAHLRTDRPLVLALASNDALSANLKNIAALLSRKSVYFVPMVQDDPSGKPHSMVADFSRVCETLSDALAGVQVRKLIW